MAKSRSRESRIERKRRKVQVEAALGRIEAAALAERRVEEAKALLVELGWRHGPFRHLP